MIKRLFSLIFCLLTVYFVQAQDVAKDTTYWQKGAGIGLDLAQLLQINPKVGAGQNRIGLGSAINYFAKYNKDRVSWDNLISWQFGVQKLGNGPVAGGEKVPFQKSIDELRLGSKVGYKTSTDSKFGYAADFGFVSLFAPAYSGDDQYPGIFLSDVRNQGLLAKFFSPATITLSLGIDYKPNDHLSVFYSPVAYKGIIVMDDEIAALNVHGNKVGKNSFNNMGSLLKALYNNKFAKDRVVFTSGLSLYSNYLENPEKIDVDWQNQIDFVIVKNLSLTVLTNLFYDYDVMVQITDYDFPNGVNGVGRKVSFTEQLLIKYNVAF